MSVTTLRGITWDHPRGYKPLEAASERYREEFGVEIVWARRSLKEFGDTPLDQLAPDYDLLIIDHPHVGSAAKLDCLMPLDGLVDTAVLAELASQSAGPSHSSYRYRDRQWALALDAAMQTSSYRPDLLDGPLPTDWTAVFELATELRRKGLWLAMPLSPTDSICSFLTFYAGLGAGLREEDTVLHESIAYRALARLKQLSRVSHPKSLDWNPIALYEAMSGGDEIAYCPIAFNYSNYARAGYRPWLVRFADLPGRSGSLLGGAGIAVSKMCLAPTEAASFAAWACSAAVQTGIYVREGGQPGNVLAWTAQDANRLTNDFFRDTLATLTASYVRPRDHGFVVFQEYAGRRIHEYLRSEAADPDECFADLSRAFAQRSELG